MEISNSNDANYLLFDLTKMSALEKKWSMNVKPQNVNSFTLYMNGILLKDIIFIDTNIGTNID